MELGAGRAGARLGGTRGVGGQIGKQREWGPDWEAGGAGVQNGGSGGPDWGRGSGARLGCRGEGARLGCRGEGARLGAGGRGILGGIISKQLKVARIPSCVVYFV